MSLLFPIGSEASTSNGSDASSDIWDNQTGFKNAIKQYKETRDPKEKIFSFARCMVHFAADTELVYMTTELRGKKSFFMPFNKGLNNGKSTGEFGAGNPVNPNGLKTHYFWEEVLSKNSLSNIIDKFAQVIEEKDEDTGKTKRKMIFPKYHQITAVKQILAHAKKYGIGKKYLQFGLVSVSALLVNLFFLYLFTEVLGFYYIISQILAIGIALIINFLGNKIWTFSK